jgi:hypothetical protein
MSAGVVVFDVLFCASSPSLGLELLQHKLSFAASPTADHSIIGCCQVRASDIRNEIKPMDIIVGINGKSLFIGGQTAVGNAQEAFDFAVSTICATPGPWRLRVARLRSTSPADGYKVDYLTPEEVIVLFREEVETVYDCKCDACASPPAPSISPSTPLISIPETPNMPDNAPNMPNNVPATPPPPPPSDPVPQLREVPAAGVQKVIIPKLDIPKPKIPKLDIPRPPPMPFHCPPAPSAQPESPAVLKIRKPDSNGNSCNGSIHTLKQNTPPTPLDTKASSNQQQLSMRFHGNDITMIPRNGKEKSFHTGGDTMIPRNVKEDGIFGSVFARVQTQAPSASASRPQQDTTNVYRITQRGGLFYGTHCDRAGIKAGWCSRFSFSFFFLFYILL